MPQSKTLANCSSKPRGGRPTKAQVARRRILETGVDPALVDPRRVLAGIAVDPAAPATARVAAARALLSATAGLPPPSEAEFEGSTAMPPEDVLTQRALALLAGGRAQ